MNDKRKVLYEQLSKDYDLGDFNSFSSKLDDENKRKALYDAVSEEYELGDYDSFVSKIAPVKNEPVDEPYTHVYDDKGNLIGGTAYQGEKVEPGNLPTLEEQVYSGVDKNGKINFGKPGFDKDEATALYPISQTSLKARLSDPRIFDTDMSLRTVNEANEEKEIDKFFVSKPMNNAKDVMDDYSARFTNTQRGIELGKELSKVTKDIQDKYVNEYLASDKYKELSSMYNGKELAQKANEQFVLLYGDAINKEVLPYQKAYNNELQLRYGKQIDEELRRINKEEASIHARELMTTVDSELEDVEKRITERTKTIRNVDWKPGMPSFRDDKKLAELRGERAYLEGAKELIEDSQKVLNAVEAEKDGSFFGGLGRGIRDSAFDIDTWTMGLSDLVGGLRLRTALEKAERGEKLTLAEERLLDASVNNMAVNYYYRNDLGRGYQAGEITGQSIPFMLEFIVNPVSASGNAIAKSLLNYGMKRFAVGTIGKTATKVGTRLVGDAIAAGGVTATSGLGNVMSGTAERLNRNYEYGLDEEGNLKVTNTNKIGLGEAFAKSATTAFLERQSEMIFNAFRGAPSLFKGVEASLPGGVNTFMNYVSNSRVGELWRGIKNNTTMRELAQRAQFHGIGEEYLEEVYNNFANIPLGEMTFEEATDLEKNIVTFLGLAPTQLMFGAIGGISYGVERYKVRRDMERTFGRMTEEQKRKLMELQEMGKLSTNRDIAIFLAETIKDENLTPEQKRDEIEYAYNLAKQNTIDEMSNTDIEDVVESDNAQIDAATDPSTGMYGEVTMIDHDENGEQVDVTVNVYGEKVVNGKLYLLVEKDGQKEYIRPMQYYPETYHKRPAEEVKAINEELVREEAAAQMERESKYAPEVVNYVPQPQDQVTDASGQVLTVVGVTSDGVTYLDEQGQANQIPIDAWRDLMQAQLEANEAAQAEAETAATNMQAVVDNMPRKTDETGRIFVPTAVQGDEVVYDITDAQGNVLEQGTSKVSQFAKMQDYAAPVEEQLNDDGTFVESSGESLGEQVNSGVNNEVNNPVEDVNPIGRGIFGDIYNQFKGKIKEGVNFLIKKRSGVLQGAFNRKEVGDIDLVWGNTKAGLYHIITKHVINQDDFSSVDNAVSTIEDVVTNGEISIQKDGRVAFSKDGYRVAIDRNEDGNWIVTALDTSRKQKEKKRSKQDATRLHQSIFGEENGELVSPQSASLSENKDSERNVQSQENQGDFISMGKEKAFNVLGEMYGEKMPNKVAVTAKALADDLAKAQQKLAKAEEAYDNAPIGREQKAEAARDKARQEFEAVKREADFWAEMDAEVKAAQQRREAMLNPTVEVNTSNEPMNAEEFVAQQLASGNIQLTVESFKKETGYGETERKKFPKLFRKAENGGMTIEQAGERLMEIDRENGTNFFDQTDANAGRDAIINLLGSVRTWGDITGFIRNNREYQAQRASEGLRNEIEEAIESNYHMTPEEYATLQEVESVENPFGGLDVATKDAIFAEAEEEYQSYLKSLENGQGTTEEVAEGNGDVLSEERADNEGGTSERQGERPDVSEGAVQQNDAAQAAEQVEEPLTIQEGESPIAFAERVVEEERRKPLRQRIREWEASGVKVNVIERVEDVTNKDAARAIQSGAVVPGWYEPSTNEVFIYMPHVSDINELDKTIIHEAISHKGLRELLGQERFNELLDKVWESMPKAVQDEWIAYEGVNGDTRAAADEYIAYLAEKETLTPEEKTIWDQIVAFFRDALDKALNGIVGKSNITDADIADLIKMSYANLKAGERKNIGGKGTRFKVYKSKDGKETKYKQLSLFGEGYEAANDGDRPDNVQREGNSAISRLNHLRELQEGEICNVERRFTESREFSFTRGEKVESTADIAYIFKSLEDEAVENSFVAIANGDNITVVHLGMGAQTQTVVDTSAIIAAVERLNADKVFFVHNHPSGEVKCSKQDILSYQSLKKVLGSRLEDGIIINTRSGRYGLFNSDGLVDANGKITSEKTEYPIKVYKFNKQAFNVDVIPTVEPSSSGIAEFVSTQRLGKRDKVNALLLNNQFGCVGNILIDNSKNMSYITERITNDAIAMGARQVVIYGRYPFVEVTNSKTNFASYLSRMISEYSQGNVNLIDIIQIDEPYSKSANDEGIRFRITNAEKESLRDSEESKALFDYAKKRFGKTYDIREAGYILPDGVMLDFSGRHEMEPGSDTSFLRGNRTVDHRGIVDVAYDFEGEETGFETDMADFINRGAIRMDGNAGSINLTMKPTPKQRTILQRLIQKMDGDVWVDFSDGWETEHYAEYSGVRPMRVLSDIDKYYDEGIKPEGNTRFRIANRNQEIFVSNAQRAVEGIKQEKGTPQQWLAMIEKNGGLKVGEDKWLGLSDWLKGLDKKSLTKDEILDFIGENKIRIEEVKYNEGGFIESLRDKYPMWDEAFEIEDDFGGVSVSLYNDKNAADIYNEANPESKVELQKSDRGYEYLNAEDEEKVIDWARTQIVSISPINSTRLNYTTKGLDNKQEIALTVPTIESWNESDEIHFGDAGEGRAIAWVRFGETFVMEDDNYIREVTEVKEPYRDVNGLDIYKTDSGSQNDFIAHGKGRNGEMIYVAYVNGRQIPVAHKTLEDAKAEMNKFFKEHPIKNRKSLNVLVIDEIQSKRHQEGREKGYKSEDLRKNYTYKEVDTVNGRQMVLNLNGSTAFYPIGTPIEEAIKDFEESPLAPDIDRRVPDAPFEKNWSELAMKRMLRYAAENGYDKVAWTTGAQQAERYSLGTMVKDIEVWAVTDPATGEVIGGEYDVYTHSISGNFISEATGRMNNERVVEVFGKDLGNRIIEGGSNQQHTVIEGEGLSIGGEGMKGFYDKMLPSFVNKYVKKWGTKVKDIELPNVEEAGRIMHSVDVTDAMKESVMEGQTMFRIKREDAQKQVVNFTSKYNSKPVVVVESSMSDEDLERAIPILLAEDIRERIENGLIGGYSTIADKIYIFADNVSEDTLEDTLFHENLHPMFKGNPMIEEFYNNFKAKYPEQVEMLSEGYKEAEIPEELFVTALATGMQKGNFKIVDAFLSDGAREELGKTLKSFGYDYEQERGRRHVERNNGESSEVARDKEVDEGIRGSSDEDSQGEGVQGRRFEESGSSERTKRVDETRKSGLNEPLNKTGYNYDNRRRSIEESVDGRRTKEGVSNISEQTTGTVDPDGRNDGRGIRRLHGGSEQAHRVQAKLPSDERISKSADQSEELRKVFERVAEVGLRGVAGDAAYDLAMIDVFHSLPESERVDVSLDAVRNRGGNVVAAVDEYLEKKGDLTLWEKVTGIIRDMLRKAGLDLDLTQNDVKYLLWRSKKPLDKGNILDVAEDIDKKYRLKVGEYSGSPTENGVLEQIKQARAEVKKNPTEAQKEAGNYKKGHIILDGYDITLENPKGGTRSGTDKNGKQWSVTMNNDYGYIRGTEAVDGDHIDIFLSDNPTEGSVFVVDQRNEDGSFDESKVMYGFNSLEEARNAYLSNYEKGWESHIMAITEVSKAEFKKWIDSSHRKTKPFSEYKNIKSDGVATRFKVSKASVSNKLNIRDEYDALTKTSRYQAREAVQDSMLSLRRVQELIEKASGKKLRDFENAWMHENRLSSVVQSEIHEMERKFYNPMLNSVKNLMKVAGLEQNEVADYMILKHAIERNREMAVRKALTDDEGKIDRPLLELWYQEKQAIRNDASLDTWRKKQEAMDELATHYGADMSVDYSGLTSMFDTDELDVCTQRAYDEVEALEASHPTETDKLWDAVNALNKSNIDKAFESGLMNRKTRDELNNDMYDYYVPLRGFDETTSDEVYAYMDNDRNAFNAPLKRAKGRTSKADSPIAYMKSIAESGIVQGNRNKMKQTFLNMVMNHPSDLVSVKEGVWAMLNPATGEWEAVAPPTIPDNANPSDVEKIIEQWDEQMEQMAEKDPNVKKIREADDVPYRVIGNKMGQHQVIVKRLGKSYTLTINGNPRLAMALNGLTNPHNTSKDGKVAAAIQNKIDALNRTLSAWYTTRNPDFVVSNFMRDTFYTNTIVRAKEGNAYANQFHKHYAELLVPGRMINLFRKYENGTLDMSNPTEKDFMDFIMNGGETGYSNLKDLEEIKKQIAKDLKGKRFENVEKVVEMLDNLNRAVENTARFAAYLTSREVGRSVERSVFDAKEISVNFNKKGAGGTFYGMNGQSWLGNRAAMVGAGGRALYVFFNAAVQGSTNLLHVMRVNPKGTSAGLAAMFLMGAVVPFLFGGGDDEEKDYYDLPEHVRRNHLIIPGWGDAWVSIPLPIEYRIMYGMGELLTSWRTGHERGSDIGRKILNLTGQALPLNFLEEGLDAFVPSAISPVWQVYNNRSWTGLPIYRDNEFNKQDPEYTKAYKNVDRLIYNFTKSMYEWTFDEENQSARIDLNPAIIESLARGYFGGLATQLGNIIKTGEMVAGERDFDWRNIPLGNRVFKSGDERTKEKRVTNEYFENMEKLDFLQSRKRTLNKVINGASVPDKDRNKAIEDLIKMEQSEVYQKYMIFKDIKKDVDKIRRQTKDKGESEALNKALIRTQEAANQAVK